MCLLIVSYLFFYITSFSLFLNCSINYHYAVFGSSSLIRPRARHFYLSAGTLALLRPPPSILLVHFSWFFVPFLSP